MRQSGREWLRAKKHRERVSPVWVSPFDALTMKIRRGHMLGEDASVTPNGLDRPLKDGLGHLREHPTRVKQLDAIGQSLRFQPIGEVLIDKPRLVPVRTSKR